MAEADPNADWLDSLPRQPGPTPDTDYIRSPTDGKWYEVPRLEQPYQPPENDQPLIPAESGGITGWAKHQWNEFTDPISGAAMFHENPIASVGRLVERHAPGVLKQLAASGTPIAQVAAAMAPRTGGLIPETDEQAAAQAAAPTQTPAQLIESLPQGVVDFAKQLKDSPARTLGSLVQSTGQDPEFLLTGDLGAASAAGKLAATAKLGAKAAATARVLGRVAGEATSFGGLMAASDAVHQLGNTDNVDWDKVEQSGVEGAGMGAAFGALRSAFTKPSSAEILERLRKNWKPGEPPEEEPIDIRDTPNGGLGSDSAGTGDGTGGGPGGQGGQGGGGESSGGAAPDSGGAAPEKPAPPQESILRTMQRAKKAGISKSDIASVMARRRTGTPEADLQSTLNDMIDKEMARKADEVRKANAQNAAETQAAADAAAAAKAKAKPEEPAEEPNPEPAPSAAQANSTSPEEPVKEAAAAASATDEAPAPLHTFKNPADGVETHVTARPDGRFAVTLHDTDAGEQVPSVKIFKTEDLAKAGARKMAGLPDLSSLPEMDQAAHQAASSPLNDLPQPTPAQVEANNAQLGHLKVHGLDISIEHPKGAMRTSKPGVEPPWETQLAAHYGYVRGTTGADGDHVDAFVGPHAQDATKPVYVVDQPKLNGKGFDETKSLIGFDSLKEAKAAYVGSYDAGAQKMVKAATLTQMSIPEYKNWLATADHTKPAAVSGIGTPVKAPTLREKIAAGGQAVSPEHARDLDEAKGFIPGGDELPGGRNILHPDAFEGMNNEQEQNARLKMGLGMGGGRSAPWLQHPEWKQRPGGKSGLSRQAANKALEKAKAGKKLGSAEQEFVDYALGVVRNRAHAEQVHAEMTDALPEFADWPKEAQDMTVLADHARQYDEDAANEALESQADDKSVSQRLHEIIAAGLKRKGESEAGPEGAGSAPKETGRPTDLFGADSERQAALNKKNAALARKLGEGRGTQPPPGGMFAAADEKAAAEAKAAQTDLTEAPEAKTATEAGASPEETKEIGEAFDSAEGATHDEDTQVTRIFDPPTKAQVVRLADKVKVYNSKHGWMTPDEAKQVISKWEDHAIAQGKDPKSRSANGEKVVLSFFDLTGSWSNPWDQAGYDVWRFDIQNDAEAGDVTKFSTAFFSEWFGDFEGKDIHAILAACPCTDFASSGARHFEAKDADGRTVKSIELVRHTLAAIEHFKPAVWAIENPVGRIERLTGLPPWRLSFDPNQLGEPYTKKTLLWGRFNADLPIAPVEPTEGSKMHQKYGGKSLRTKNARSATPEGFSYGFFMANNAIDNPALAISGKYDRLDKGLIDKAVAAGITESQINEAVEDHYYMDLDDAAASAAIKQLIADKGKPVAAPKQPLQPPAGTPAQKLQWRIDNNLAMVRDQYAHIEGTEGGKIISADLAKFLSPEYADDRSLSDSLQKVASQFADAEYRRKLAESPDEGEEPQVIFTSGGTGAGKSTGLRLNPKATAGAQIVYDGNMSNLEVAIKRIDLALAAGKHVYVQYVYREPAEAYRNGVIPRAKGPEGRPVTAANHAKTHAGSYAAIKGLQEKYGDNPNVDIFAIDNSRGKKKAAAIPIERVPNVDYNAAHAASVRELDKAFREGSVSDRIYRSLGGTLDAAEHATSPGEEAGGGLSGKSEQAGRRSRVKPGAKPEIQDFGQKIHGARKDYASEFQDAMGVDVAKEPLSKSWPEPDYDKLLAGGADPWAVGFMHAARDEIPTKPSKRWKLERWVKQVSLLREFSVGLATGKIPVETVKERMAQIGGLGNIADRVDLYQAVGHDKSLKTVTVGSGRFSVFEKQVFDPAKVIWTVSGKMASNAMSRWPKILAKGDTREEAIENFKQVWNDTDAETDKKKAVAFDIYSDYGKTPKAYFVGKKMGGDVHRFKEGFATAQEARAWRDANHDQLVKDLSELKDVPFERRSTNSPRVGIDHRNGADVTPEAFADSFGFRGVQFGNYVEGAKRQADLNEAYDALMDLAGIIDVPPQALSLNGELGLAFGARGHGGKNPAAAHYEPDHVVINLTKMRGAGSLAHEWFHAADNYFARAGGTVHGYVTDPTRGGKAVRPEMNAAFKNVMSAIRNQTDVLTRSRKLDKLRSKPYWATDLEMAARSFEAYIIAKLQDQSASNDYLANILPQESWDAMMSRSIAKAGTYPYPAQHEMAPIRDSFDKFFQTVETKGAEERHALFARSGNQPFYSAAVRAVESVPLRKASAEQWWNTIRNKPGVKPEELQWMGLEDWLKQQSGPISKEQVADFMRANQLQVSETMLGEGTQTAKTDDHEAHADLTVKLTAAGYEPEFDYDADFVGIRDAETGAMYTMSPETDEWDDGEGQGELPPDVAEMATRLGEVSQRLQEYMGNGWSEDSTRFQQYSMPGGWNYRELLLSLPERPLKGNEGPAGWAETSNSRSRAGDDNFRSSHWNVPNVLAHVRLDERNDVDGKKLLFVEEIQSDWHQGGRKRGYRSDDYSAAMARYKELEKIPDSQRTAEQWEEFHKVKNIAYNTSGTVPEAPFKTSWPELAFKRVIRYAADNGFDRIAWTTGEQQADRYDLSKRISKVVWRKAGTSGFTKDAEIENNDGGTLKAYDLDGRMVIDKYIPQTDISEYVGKDVAEKLVAQKPASVSHGGLAALERTVSGLDLKVGGEGMAGFYDDMLPKIAAKIGKRWGAKVGTTKVEAGVERLGGGTVGKPIGTKITEQHSMDIPPAMAEAAQAGLPLFRRTQASTGATDEVRRYLDKVQRSVEGTFNVMRHTTPAAAEPFIGESVPPDALGAYTPADNTIHFIESNLDTVEKAQAIFRHEGIGHAAMERTEGFKKAVSMVGTLKDAGGPRITKLWNDVEARQPGLTDLAHRKEVIALMAERGVKNAIMDRAITGVVQLLGKVGIKVPPTEAQLRAMIVLAARQLPEEARELAGVDAKGAQDDPFLAEYPQQPQQSDVLFARAGDDDGGLQDLNDKYSSDSGARGPQAYEAARSIVAAIPNSELALSFKRILSPVNMDDLSRETARMTTEAFGKLAHDTHEATQLLEQYAQMVDKLPPQALLDSIHAIETGAPQPIRSMQPMADTLRSMLDIWREKVQGLGTGALDNWIENYFPHIWRDQKKASKLINMIMGRRPLKGPATFLKKRSIPTLKEGMELGLKPLTINPLTLALIKTREMQRFVTGVRLMQKLKDSGLAKYFPTTKPIPQGWVEIKDAVGRVRQWSEEEGGFIERGRYAMPENAARIINNHLSASALAGWLPVEALKVGANMLNAVQLGVSAFHLGFTSMDVIASKNSLALERLAHGEYGQAAEAFISGLPVLGPVEAVRNIIRGSKLLKAYSNIGQATPQLQAIVRALEMGGGRVSMGHEFQTAQGISPFKGVGIQSLAHDIHTVMTQPHGKIEGLTRTLGSFPLDYATRLKRDLQQMAITMPKWQIPMEITGRMIRAGTSIIMEHIVPRQKLGVFSDMAADWLRRNPNADPVEMTKAMQSIWWAIDKRMGEVVYDNLYWNRTFKDINHLMWRAVGWKYGKLAIPVEGASDLMHMIDNGVRDGKINADDLGHDIPYLMSMIYTTAIIGAISTYLYLGHGPQQLLDYFFPPTGGKTRYGTPQRISLPGYMKDYVEMVQNPSGELTRGLNPFWGMTSDLLKNEDYAGKSIYNPEGTLAENAKDVGSYVKSEATPFSLSNRQKIHGAEQPGAEGAINRGLPFIGVTVAPAAIASHEQLDRAQRLRKAQSYLGSVNMKIRDAQQAGDVQEVHKLQERADRTRAEMSALQREVTIDKIRRNAAAREAQ